MLDDNSLCMKKILLLLLIIFLQLNANGQNIINDSLPQYELFLDKLPKFLEENIGKWKKQIERSSERRNIGFGVLSIDSIGKHVIKLSFSYYYEKFIFKECIQNAWGIYNLEEIPILLCGKKDERILLAKNMNIVFTRRKDYFNGLIDPFYIRIKLNLK